MSSLRKLVDRKCKECTYDPSCAGSWRFQTQECTVKSCALWEVRPMTTATVVLNRKERASTELDIEAMIDDLEDEVAETV